MPRRTRAERPNLRLPPAPDQSSRLRPSRRRGDTAPAEAPSGWHTELSGYFRAPMAMGISSRPSPDSLDSNPMSPTNGKLIGPSQTQYSYGPNRTVDANYYSFAYTRLQEQDWAEFFIHAKKKHVDAAVGWMGYWYRGGRLPKPDAGGRRAWPISRSTLTSSSRAQHRTSAATAGAWWPSFGYMEKYDTYTLGRFRQMGEQLQWTASRWSSRISR